MCEIHCLEDSRADTGGMPRCGPGVGGQGHTYTQYRRDASLMHSREPSPSRPHREEKATQT